MAVTIEEMQVDVTPSAAGATPTAGGNDAQKKGDIRGALEILHERRSRLLAD
ncbi:MAG: hypothetical protein WB615_01465 [Candidatus Tumulicola sp.]